MRKTPSADAASGSALVSVIVTTKDSARTLEACLQSMRRQRNAEVELVVVDNGSTDATREIAARYADTVVTYGPERSAQRNHGAAITSGEHLLFLDSDMIVGEDVVAEGMAALRASGLPACIIPELSVGEGFWTRSRAHERSCYDGDDDIEAARLYTREAFDAAGGFDEDISGGEDWDLSQRVARGRSLPRTRSRILHDEGRLALGIAFQKRRYYAPGYLRYRRKHRAVARSQSNPLARAAYLRHWRRLVAHPVLTAGMIVLKAVEAGAVAEVAAEQALQRTRARARPSPGPSQVGVRPLLVTFGSVLHPDGGLQVRSRVLGETLARLGRPPVVVSTREPRAADTDACWARIIHVPARKPKWGLSLEFARLIRRSARGCDLVIIANAMFMPALTISGVRGVPVLWDTNECQTLHYSRLPRTPANLLKLAIWRGLETWAARRCRIAVAIGGAEAEQWVRLHPSLRGKLATVDHAAFTTAPDARAGGPGMDEIAGARIEGPLLVFVGNATAKHNAAAAAYIVDTLAPQLPESCTVVLCGPATERFQPRPQGARVLALGEVASVDPLIARATVCLAPLAAGAGVKTKVLHYLAHGRPVAGTPVAFEGLDGAPGLYAAGLGELPALVARLIADPEPEVIAEARATAQRSWLDEHHGRVHVTKQWQTALERLTSRPQD